MNIYDFAFEMEKDSEKYYRDLANKSNHEGFKNILNMLADEEKNHQEFVLKLINSRNEKKVESNILNDIKNIFAKMSEEKKDISINISEVELYKKAQELEKKSEKFYLDKANESEDKSVKDLLNMLANEEKKHFFILDNIIEFVNRPATWLENAEFNHLDEY
jgi:rubrerythrin